MSEAPCCSHNLPKASQRFCRAPNAGKGSGKEVRCAGRKERGCCQNVDKMLSKWTAGNMVWRAGLGRLILGEAEFCGGSHVEYMLREGGFGGSGQCCSRSRCWVGPGCLENPDLTVSTMHLTSWVPMLSSCYSYLQASLLQGCERKWQMVHRAANGQEVPALFFAHKDVAHRMKIFKHPQSPA